MSTQRNRDRLTATVSKDLDNWKDGWEQTPTSTPMSGGGESIADSVTPNFHARIAAGEIINNNMHYESDFFNNTSGGHLIRRYAMDAPTRANRSEHGKYGVGSLTAALSAGNAHPGFLSLEDASPSLVVEAKSKCLGFVDRSPYSFAEDIGELKETIRFLKNPTKSLRDLTQTFSNAWKTRRRAEKLKRAGNLAKAFAEVWVNYSFAYSPLLRSINDAIESRFVDITRPPRKVARGNAEWVQFDTDTTVKYNIEYARVAKQDVSVRAGILYEVTNPLNDWKYKYGLRFKDIPEGYWALLPYSFMVDRLINISQTLRGMEAFLDPNVKFLAGWVTTKTGRTRSISAIADVNTQVVGTLTSPDTNSLDDFVYDRTIWEPSFFDTIGSFDPKGIIADSTKVADLVSLILVNIRM